MTILDRVFEFIGIITTVLFIVGVGAYKAGALKVEKRPNKE
jgi:hypothetical protein